MEGVGSRLEARVGCVCAVLGVLPRFIFAIEFVAVGESLG